MKGSDHRRSRPSKVNVTILSVGGTTLRYGATGTASFDLATKLRRVTPSSQLGLLVSGTRIQNHGRRRTRDIPGSVDPGAVRPGPTGHRPTARSDASTEPSPRAAPSRSSTPQSPPGSQLCQHGSTTTTTTGLRQPRSRRRARRCSRCRSAGRWMPGRPSSWRQRFGRRSSATGRRWSCHRTGHRQAPRISATATTQASTRRRSRRGVMSRRSALPWRHLERLD